MDSRFSPEQLTHTLPLQVADRIGAGIVEEKFAPGERLKETDLAQAFAVSRATIREALRILQARGLVQILPQRGAHVTQLSAKELEDFFEIRAVLLGLGSGRAALVRSDADVQLLNQRLRELDAHRDDLEAYARTSAALVEDVVRISGSVALVAYINEFAQRIGRYVRLGLTSAARRQKSIARWRKLVQAIGQGDSVQAETLHRALALENRGAALLEFKRRQALTVDRPS